MLSALLLALKLLSLFLLILFLLILLLLLLLLLSPFRYRGEGRRRGKTDASFELSWLFHVFYLRFSYEEEAKLHLRLLGFPLRGGGRKSRANSGEAEEGDEFGKSDEDGEAYETGEIYENSEAYETGESYENSEAYETGEVYKAGETGGKKESGASGGEGRRRASVRRRRKVGRLLERLRSLLRRTDEIRTFLADRRTENALRLFRQKLLRILRELCPRRFSGYCRFGLDDPFAVGQICSAAALLFPLFEGRLELQPVFDEQVLEAELRLQGRVRLIFILLPALQLWFHRDFQYVYRSYRKRKRAERTTEENDG